MVAETGAARRGAASGDLFLCTSFNLCHRQPLTPVTRALTNVTFDELVLCFINKRAVLYVYKSNNSIPNSVLL